MKNGVGLTDYVSPAEMDHLFVQLQRYCVNR